MPVIEQYLEAVATHDWDTMRACLRDDVVRIGPFRDEFHGRDDYMTFLTELMPSLPGYSMDIARITYADDGRLAFAELAETIDVDGRPLRTEESLVFELDDSARIARIDIFIKTSLGAPADGM
ncbi:MAG TPA: nuclear transport factor 2 family protein [Acidimicrobiales bacterium]|jgi:limonene-1,2-epoxide hydrolase